MALATLIKDGQRVEAKDKAEADKLFAQGFQLETSPPAGGAPPSGGNQNPYLEAILNAFEAPEYKEAQSEYDKALSGLTELQSKAPGYLDRESQRYETADPVLQMLLKQRGEQTGDISSVAAEARNKYKDIFDPRQREALVAQAIGNVTGQLAGTTGLVEQQRGFAGQQAQTSLDALLAETGLAQTALGAAGEKKDFLSQLLMGAAGQEYIPKSEDEWADLEKMLGLEKQYSTSGGTTSGGSGGLTDLQLYNIGEQDLENQGAFGGFANRIMSGEDVNEIIAEATKGGFGSLVDGLIKVEEDYKIKKEADRSALSRWPEEVWDLIKFWD